MVEQIFDLQIIRCSGWNHPSKGNDSRRINILSYEEIV